MGSKLDTAFRKYCKRNNEDRKFKHELKMLEEIMIENNLMTFVEDYNFLYNLDTVLLNLDYSTPERKRMLTEFNTARCYE